MHATGFDNHPIYWLGGSPCSGKSSVAALLAAEYGLRNYECDAHYAQHLEEAEAEHRPAMTWVKGATWDEIWMRPVVEQIESEIQFYREEFPMILADLEALLGDSAQPVLVEGAAVLPGLLADWQTPPNRALFMIPDPDFQRRVYRGRGDWVEGILAACREPETAFRNWMERDIGFGAWVKDEATKVGYPVIVVDGSRTIEVIARQVAQHFRLT